MRVMRLLVGLPASGKSTYARSLTDGQGKWASINWDTLRWFDDHGHSKDYKFSKQNEQAIKDKSVQIAKDYVEHGFNLIIDNTNLSQATRQFWIGQAIDLGMKIETIEFNTDLDECLRRNDLRTGWQRVPRPVIERMALFNDLVNWPKGPGLGAVLVDIDGTLADGSHRQHYVSTACSVCGSYKVIYKDDDFMATDCPACKGAGTQKKQWDKYFSLLHLDTPIQPVIEWVRSLKDEGYYVCLVSGRGLENGQQTIDWLKKHNVVYDRIFMRNAGDSREDSVVKKEILDKITPNIQVAFVIDDRPRVIRMWRENGLRCYDVGKGVEF